MSEERKLLETLKQMCREDEESNQSIIFLEGLLKRIEMLENDKETLINEMSERLANKDIEINNNKIKVEKLEQRLDLWTKEHEFNTQHNERRYIEGLLKDNKNIRSVLQENNSFLDSLASYFARKGEKDITLDIRTHLTRMRELEKEVNSKNKNRNILQWQNETLNRLKELGGEKSGESERDSCSHDPSIEVNEEDESTTLLTDSTPPEIIFTWKEVCEEVMNRVKEAKNEQITEFLKDLDWTIILNKCVEATHCLTIELDLLKEKILKPLQKKWKRRSK